VTPVPGYVSAVLDDDDSVFLDDDDSVLTFYDDANHRSTVAAMSGSRTTVRLETT
jgi:hypothetical protein